MRVQVDYNGITYTSAEIPGYSNEVSFSNYIREFYEDINDEVCKMSLDLEDGSVMMFAAEVFKKCVFRFYQ